MASIDNRVVQITFDNAAFERKLSETINSLNALQKSLDFANQKQSLGEVADAANKFNLGGMSSAIEGVSKSFIALSTIAITVLANITNKAVDAGLQIAKSLTIQPLLDGFREYEMNMNSIQTILSNTKADGTTLDDVTAALDELNAYADKTIYNFGQMTKNIGTFSAAGVDLETSVQSIKGISNLAAISGSSAEQASSAMYQLSQAVSTGTLRLIDWNSVVNAGMGGEVFQKALFETGKALGTIADVPIDQTFEQWTSNGNSFRASLEDNWLTAEVLTTTLQGFTGEMTEAQLLAIGYTKEQAAQIIELGKTGVDAATKVRTFTGLMQTTKESIASGWAESFRILIGDFEQATELFSGISGFVSGIVGKVAEDRNARLQAFVDGGGRDDVIAGLKAGFMALYDVFNTVGKAFRSMFPQKSTRELLSMAENFREFMENIRPSEATLKNVGLLFKGFFAILAIGWEIIKQTTGLIVDLFKSLTGAGSGEFLQFAGNIGQFFIDLKKSLVDGDGIANFFESIRQKIADVIDWFKNIDLGFEFPPIFGEKGAATKATEEGVSTLTKVRDKLEAFVESVGRIAKKIATVFSDVLSSIGDFFKGFLDGAGDFLGDASITNIAALLGGGGLAGIFLVLKRGLRFDFRGGIFDSIGDTLKSLTGTLEAMQTKIKAQALMYIAIGIGVLAASLLLLSMVDPGDLAKALTAIAVSFTQLIAAFAILNKMETSAFAPVKMAAIAIALGTLGVAIFILAASAMLLARLDWNELSRGLLGVTVLMGVLVTTAKLLQPHAAGMIQTAFAMTGMAFALGILSIAVWAFSTMDWDQMLQGLLGVSGALIAVSAGMQLMPKDLASRSAGIFAIAASLLVLGLAIKMFSMMDLTTMAMGFAGVASGLAAVGLGMRSFPEKMATTAGSLLLISIAIVILGYALKKMAELSLLEIGKGVIGIAGTLIVLARAITVMKKSTPGAVALLLVALSLRSLAGVLRTFASMPLGDLVKGLLAVAAVIGVFAAGALLLQPALPAMFTLGIALAAIGLGFTLFGLGASLFANAFLIIVEVASKGTVAITEALNTLISVMPLIGQAFGAFLIALATGFLIATPEIVEAATNLVLALLQAFIDILPKVAEAALAFITTLLDVLRVAVPDIVDAAYDILVAFLNTFAEHIDDIVAAGVNILVNLIEGLARNVDDLVAATVDLIVEFLGAIEDNIDDVITAGADLIIAVIEGLESNYSRIITAGTDAVIKFIEGLASNAIKLARGAGQVILDLLVGLRKAVDDYLPEITEEGVRLMGAIIAGMAKGIVGGLGGLVKDLGGGLIGGVMGFLGIKSPSREFIKVGNYIIEGLAVGLDDTGPVDRNIKRMSNNMLDKVSQTISAIPEIVDGMDQFNPTITPVLDLTKLATDAKAISSFFPETTVSAAQASSISQLLSQERDLETVGATQPSQIQFVQTINSPSPLSAADIYRQTRNQINFAKEELSIP